MAENAGSVKAACDGFCQMSDFYDEWLSAATRGKSCGADRGTPDRSAEKRTRVGEIRRVA